MSACYAIYCKLKFNKEKEKDLLKKMENCYQKHQSESIGFCIEKYPFAVPSSVEDYLALYFVEHQKVWDIKYKELKNGKQIYECRAGFNASYGWCIVMTEFFKEIGSCLLDGSQLSINDDDPIVIYRVKDGKVV